MNGETNCGWSVPQNTTQQNPDKQKIDKFDYTKIYKYTMAKKVEANSKINSKSMYFYRLFFKILGDTTSGQSYVKQ